VRTAKEIAKEIITLKDYQPRVRAHTLFGDDNRAAIGAQIEVLEKLYDSDRIEDKWGMDGDEPSEHVRDNAMTARYWLEGDEKELAAGWSHLLDEQNEPATRTS
jgi:hypothetical protein